MNRPIRPSTHPGTPVPRSSTPDPGTGWTKAALRLRSRRLATSMLVRLSARAGQIVAGGLGTIGATKYQYIVLGTVTDLGPVSQADLSRSTGIDRSDVVAILNDLEDRGAIARTLDPADRRRNLVTVTPHGAELLAGMVRIVDDAQDTFLAPLDADQREHFLHLLRVLLDDPETDPD